MTSEEIFEGNKLIAGFMNYFADMIRHSERFNIPYNWEEDIVEINCLTYHSSWNALMPVIEKIETMDYGFKMCRKVVEIYIDSTKEVIIKNKEKDRITGLYKSVVEFVKLYNTKK